MATPRGYAAAAALPSGVVVVAGGRVEDPTDADSGVVVRRAPTRSAGWGRSRRAPNYARVRTAEHYDPLTDAWRPPPPMASAREGAVPSHAPSHATTAPVALTR